MIMQTVDGNGKFIISVPFMTKSDPESCSREHTDVKLTALELKKVTIFDIANAIANDCFGLNDHPSLEIASNTLDCLVLVGERKYVFSVSKKPCFEEYLMEIAKQIML